MIKAIVRFFKYIFETTELGFYQLCLILAKGFFFYFYFVSLIFEKIFRLKLFTRVKDFFKQKQGDPVAFLMLVLFFFVGVFLHTYLYVDQEDVKYVDEDAVLSPITDSTEEYEEPPRESTASDKETYSDNEVNLFRKYGKLDINTVNFDEFKAINEQVVAWIMVDGTSVNYPIVQSDDNEYYLNHDITWGPRASGWPFMDFRNSKDLSDNNTIFYGHNLLNRTAFGSLGTVLTDKWYKNSNHLIVVRTPEERHVYRIFSVYVIDFPDTYYLQTNFFSPEKYQDFLNTISLRSKFDFSVPVGSNDRIITLSTCSDDNKGRKVIHAKMIE